ncbi:MAG TPA: diaminopimelate decarboxylase [Spirochaetota bacterium]|nr:diaminopimelate decarboxylase [Spirochaetota bacterium]
MKNTFDAYFNYRDNELHCDDVSLAKLADEFNTPLYVYSKKALKERYAEIDSALGDVPHVICYSVKSNSNLSVLELMKDMGAGMDVVSGGELFRAIKIGVKPEKIVYAGVGKTGEEIEYALIAGIRMFNCESFQEIEAIDYVAGQLGKNASIAIRVNPDVDANTHHYITTGKKENKFGITVPLLMDNLDILKKCKNITLKGIHAHIGSQIVTVEPFENALDRLMALIENLKSDGFTEINTVNLGGGFGIRYNDEELFDVNDWASIVKERVNGSGLTLIIEPGRYIAGNSGALVTRVVYKKKSETKTFLITDTGMHHLIRPSLYGAFQHIRNCSLREGSEVVDVVGPICESGDFFARDREISLSQQGDLLAVLSAGAYGMVMASRYNSHPMPAEVMVNEDGTSSLIRRRESYDDIIRHEVI